MKKTIKKFLKGFGVAVGAIVGFIILLVLIFGVLYGFGKVGNKLEETIGTEYKNVKREQFENSTSYIHGMTDRLSEYKRQYDTESDINNKIAILNTIDDEFASFDESKINNSTLRSFLLDVRSGELRGQLNTSEGDDE